MHNEFSCLSNALLVAGLRCGLPVAFVVPPRVRGMMKNDEARKVRAVTLHQCPKAGNVIHYVLEVHMINGKLEVEEFDVSGNNHLHEDIVLYDRGRDGVMKHLHFVH